MVMELQGCARCVWLLVQYVYPHIFARTVVAHTSLKMEFVSENVLQELTLRYRQGFALLATQTASNAKAIHPPARSVEHNSVSTAMPALAYPLVLGTTTHWSITLRLSAKCVRASAETVLGTLPNVHPAQIVFCCSRISVLIAAVLSTTTSQACVFDVQITVTTASTLLCVLGVCPASSLTVSV